MFSKKKELEKNKTQLKELEKMYHRYVDERELIAMYGLHLDEPVFHKEYNDLGTKIQAIQKVLKVYKF